MVFIAGAACKIVVSMESSIWKRNLNPRFEARHWFPKVCINVCMEQTKNVFLIFCIYTGNKRNNNRSEIIMFIFISEQSEIKAVFVRSFSQKWQLRLDITFFSQNWFFVFPLSLGTLIIACEGGQKPRQTVVVAVWGK